MSKLRTESIIMYLDDIIVATTDEEEHLKDLEKVLRLHRHAGIKLKAKKTFLFQKSVSYLGFRVSEEGIRMQSEYVDRIVNWPNPRRPSNSKVVSGLSIIIIVLSRTSVS